MSGLPVWQGETIDGHVYYSAYSFPDSTPGLWFASTPEAFTEMRAYLLRKLGDSLYEGDIYAVLRAIGFTDG